MSENKRYSIPWRKKLAAQYHIKEQYILDMTKNQINAFELGVAAGIAKQTDELKANYILLDKADEAIYRDFVAAKKQELEEYEMNEE